MTLIDDERVDDTQPYAVPPDIGPLAVALAKAHTKFDKVTRDKNVTVQTKSGGSYTFSYAPLDAVLAATVPALSENGLAVVQMLDGGTLVTTLLHESGASISGRVKLPVTGGVQELGSAITYLRRYAIQALLGIAAEEDDDGNAAAGNRVEPATPQPELTADGGLIGTAEVHTAPADFELRQTPEGNGIAFKLKSGRTGFKVVAHDPLASALARMREQIIGQRVTCWGSMGTESFRPKGARKDVEYPVLTLTRIQTADFTLPAPEALTDPVAPGQEALPLTDDEKELIAGNLG